MSTPAKVKPVTSPVVFTANRLRDGRVVWLGGDTDWVEGVAVATVFTPEAAEAGLARAKLGEARQHVVGVYAVDVVLRDGRPEPVKFRERLRAVGPSITAEPAECRLAS